MAHTRSRELLSSVIAAVIAVSVVLALPSGARAQITLEVLHAFALQGQRPTTPLIQAADGNFYGTTEDGGFADGGTVFKITPAGVFTTLHSFACSDTEGCGVDGGLVQATDGNFYGTTSGGGTNFAGTVFKITPTGNFSTLHVFDCSTEGCGPDASLILGTDGNLYGTTRFGGVNDGGTVFKITLAGAVTVLHPFDCNTEGCRPSASLIQATDSAFYGTTEFGVTDGGTLFKVTAAGAFTTLHVFDCATEGCQPTSSLIQASDGAFYGTAAQGGTGSGGTIFKITAGGDFTPLHAFDCASEGCIPLAALIQTTDGTFYGTANEGGLSGHGTVFSFTTAGVFANLHSFNCDTGGCDPIASLLLATDGKLYGTTFHGGVFFAGTVFSITPAGVFTTVHEFGCGDDGCLPNSGVIQAADGNFYGTTGANGDGGRGTIFTVTPAGVFTALNTFDCGSAGQCLQGLVQATDGDFYGMSQQGGTNDQGAVFKITAAGVITTLHSFACDTDGCFPRGSLIQATDGNFYGTTLRGGTNGRGTVFKMTAAGAVTTLHSFDCNTEGCDPSAGLIEATDGNFYGTTQEGDNNFTFFGTVFKMTAAGALTPLHFFTCGTEGCAPAASLIQATDGNFYGTTSGVDGSVFKITPTGDLTTLHLFDCSIEGCIPEGGLVQAADGNFYGTTGERGAFDGGTIFRITPAGALVTLHSFDCSDGCNPSGNLTIGSDGKFYGTTFFGGANAGGGVIFRLSVGSIRLLDAVGPATVWVGLKNSDAIGLKVDLRAEVFVDTTKVAEGEVDNVSTGSSTFQKALLNSIPLLLSGGSPAAIPPGSTLGIKLSVRRTCEEGPSHNTGTVLLWYDGKAVDTGTRRDAASRFDASLDGNNAIYYLRSSLNLNLTPGTSKKSIAIALDSKEECPDRTFKSFGTWSILP